MKRRQFIALLSGAAAWPLAAPAQQPRRLGALMAFVESDPEVRKWLAAFWEGMHKLGWNEGQNVQMDYRWATSDVGRMEQFAKELVALSPDLIVSSSTPTTRFLMQQTRTIPIVFTNIVDPVGSGFLVSLAKPGGNVTGFVNLDATITGKYLELLKEIAPRVSRVAISYNPSTATYAEIYLAPFRAAAASLGVEPVVAPVRDLTELETLVAALAREPNSGLVAMPDSFNSSYHAQIASLVARYRLPAIHALRQFAVHGGLISYGNDIADNYRRVASYVHRILNGEKPAELPAQFPVKFDLVINIKAAKALDLDVPLFLQQRADEVIE
jgi:putative ABC transport system substrate-binding protein